MTARLRIFVSSVQKELEDERLIVQNLVNTDPFLSAHCIPVLYEFEPASPDKALEGCLEALDGCQVYLLIVGVQYGTPWAGCPSPTPSTAGRRRWNSPSSRSSRASGR